MKTKHTVLQSLFSITYRNMFFFYVFLCSFLPSGFLFSFPIKYLVWMILVILTFAAYWFKAFLTRKDLILLIFFISIILIYTLYGLYQFPFQSVISELSAMIGFFSVLFFASTVQNFVKSDKNLLLTSLKSAVYGAFAFCVSKSLVFILLIFNVIEFNYISEKIFPIINYKPVLLGIEGGGSRFSFVTLDFLTVIIFSIYLYCRKSLKGLLKTQIFFYLFLLVLGLSLFSAYSRALFVVAPFLFLIVLFLKSNYRTMFFMFIISLIILLIFQDFFQAVFEQRFSNQGHSDSWRYMMINSMLYYINEAPVFGYGIGSYMTEFVRDPDVPYSYEVQFISFVFKFGIVFLVFYFILLGSMFFKIDNKLKFLAFVIFILWSLLSFTNQYFFNTTSSVVGLLLFLIYKLQQNSRNHVNG